MKRQGSGREEELRGSEDRGRQGKWRRFRKGKK